MNFDVKSIGSLRRKLGLTQNQLAKLSGVSQSLIAKIESNRIDPAYSKVVAIFQAIEQEMNRKKQTKKARDLMTRDLVYVSPEESLEKVIKLMKQKAISQVPIFDGKNYVGSVTDDMFVDWFTKYGNRLGNVMVSEVMHECFPIIPVDSDIDIIVEMLKFYKALLVANGKVVGIITKADLMKAMK
ncbi:MAG: CBS domain-containing protein [Candidatus Micrarchaeota archaeon]